MYQFIAAVLCIMIHNKHKMLQINTGIASITEI